MFKKVLIISLSLALSLSFSLYAGSKADLEKEKTAIKQAALDYIEGWFEGSQERMARALHPALHKVGFRPYTPNGKPVLTPIGYTAMVELARMGIGKKVGKDKAKITVKILSVSKNIAAVKTTCIQFIDYLLLAKMEGQWKIVNVLWEPTPPPPAK